MLRPISWVGVCALAWTVTTTGPGAAAEKSKAVFPPDPEAPTVELFAGIASGELEVRVIPKDSAECRLVVRNKTAAPLNVRMPEAFAAMPVLAQFQQNPLFQGVQGQNNSQAPQGLGVGGPGGGVFGQPQGGVFGQGQGLFNVAPEKPAQWRLPSVCLEHGRPEPKPAVAYEVKPIDTIAAQPAVVQLCAMLGRGEIGQKPAQAAAWNLQQGMSWNELRAEAVKLPFGARRPYFRPDELAVAKRAAERAAELAGPKPQSTSLTQRTAQAAPAGSR